MTEAFLLPLSQTDSNYSYSYSYAIFNVGLVYLSHYIDYHE